jgi:hypothetical protein
MDYSKGNMEKTPIFMKVMLLIDKLINPCGTEEVLELPLTK